MVKQIQNCDCVYFLYNLYLYNIIKYYYPIINKSIYTINYNTCAKYNKYNKIKSNLNIIYIYKFQIIEYNNRIFYNRGICYHTSDNNINNILDKTLVNFDIDIESIQIKLLSNTNSEYIIIDENFINNILNFSTPKSKLEPLLYYYLQINLLNFDKIIDVEFKINNKYIKINIDNILENLFNKFI